MSKAEADYCKRIEIWWLFRDMKGRSYKSADVSWGENSSHGAVTIQVSIWNDDKYVRLIYTQTNRDTGEKKDFDYKIPLVETPCHLGGKRYWFKCPLYTNGTYCGRRVGVLYKNGDYFACRHCYNLTYSSRKLSGIAKSFGKFASLPEIEKLMKAVKRTHYRGKPTKKYLRYLKKEDQFKKGFMGMVGLFSQKFGRIKDKD